MVVVADSVVAAVVVAVAAAAAAAVVAVDLQRKLKFSRTFDPLPYTILGTAASNVGQQCGYRERICNTE